MQDHEDDQELLANKQAKSLFYSLGQAAGGIGLYVNVYKTEYMCFKQKRVISTISGKLRKLDDLFTYCGSNILSTEGDINIRLKA